MQKREKYLPVELDFGSARARVRIKVRENETAEEMAKRIDGIEVEETRMGAYIRSINLQDFLFKNKDVIVDYLEGDVKSVDGKNEQWIQVYVDQGLPVLDVNGEAIGLGISNFYVGGVNVLTIKDEEKTERYMQDFSSSDVKAITSAATSNKVSVSCPGGMASAEISRKVFDVFFLLKEDGVVSFYDGSPKTEPLGWKEWIFPENFNRKPSISVEYLVAAAMLKNKKIHRREISRDENQPYYQPYYQHENYLYYHHENSEKGENPEEQKIEDKKTEDQNVYTPPVSYTSDAKLHGSIRNEQAIFTQETSPAIKPKTLTVVYPARLREYVMPYDMGDEEKGFGRIKKMKKRMKRNGKASIKVMVEEKQKQNNQNNQKENIFTYKNKKNHEKIPDKKNLKGIKWVEIVKRVKIARRWMLTSGVFIKFFIRKIRLKIRSKIAILTTLKENIKNIKNIKKVRNIKAELINKIKKNVGKIKGIVVRIAHALMKGSKHRKPRKNRHKSKWLIILLMLGRWFPKIKIKGVKRCFL